MSKLKVFLVICFSALYALGFSSVYVKADVVPGTNYEIISDFVLYDKTTNELYEFENADVLNTFLESKVGIATRSYVPSERRTVVNRVYEKVHTSGHQIPTVYGGPNGGTMTLTHGVSVNVEGITSSITSGMSYTLPKYKYGNIVLKTRMRYTEYRMETRIKIGYNNYTRWQYAGTYTVKNVASNWYEPVYW